MESECARCGLDGAEGGQANVSAARAGAAEAGGARVVGHTGHRGGRAGTEEADTVRHARHVVRLDERVEPERRVGKQKRVQATEQSVRRERRRRVGGECVEERSARARGDRLRLRWVLAKVLVSHGGTVQGGEHLLLAMVLLLLLLAKLLLVVAGDHRGGGAHNGHEVLRGVSRRSVHRSGSVATQKAGATLVQAVGVAHRAKRLVLVQAVGIGRDRRVHDWRRGGRRRDRRQRGGRRRGGRGMIQMLRTGEASQEASDSRNDKDKQVGSTFGKGGNRKTKGGREFVCVCNICVTFTKQPCN